MTTKKSIKNLIKNRLHQNTKEIIIDISAFHSFYKQQIIWIKEHIEYENDMDKNLNKDNKVLSRFDISQYVSNFDNYFKDQNYYTVKVEKLFHLILLFLDPPSDILNTISKENRKKLFSGILFNISLNTNINLSDLIKTYYSQITNITKDTTNLSKEAILEFYKESIELVDKNYEKIKETNLEYSKKSLIDTPSLLTELLKSFNINDHKDIHKIINTSHVFSFIFSLLIYSLILILLITFRNSIDTYFNITYDLNSFPLFTTTFIIILLILFLIHTIIFTKNLIRKKLFLRTLRSITRYFSIAPNVLETYFKKKFNFDYKKLR